MCRRAVLILGLASGCGRVDFEPVHADANHPDVSGCPAAITAPPTVSIIGRTFRYLDFDNTWTHVSGAMITARSALDNSTLGQTVSDGAGMYSLAMSTGGEPVQPILVVDAGGTDFLSEIHFNQPVAADIVVPPLMTNDVFSTGDAPVWDVTAIQAIYQQVFLGRDAARGTLNIAVRDCADLPLEGVTIELDPPSELLRYQAVDGTASTSLTSTGPPFGHALAFNSPAGPTRILARKAGVVIADQTIVVNSGNTYTLAIVRAPP